MRIWLPFASISEAIDAIGGEIPGVEVDVYNSDGVCPDSIAEVEYVALPYMMAADKALARISEMKSLKVLQVLSAGYENYLPYLPNGVTLSNGSGIPDIPTAELALALALTSLREFDAYARNQQSGNWEPRFTDSLADKRVTIFGYGSIGKAIEARVAAFEPASITRVARTARVEGGVNVHSFTELDEILQKTDVLFLITPLTLDTEGIIGEHALSLLPDGALVVNASRGKVVDTQALIAQCAAGRLRAALDVTDPEPLPADHPLWHTKGVFISPHVGGQSKAILPRIKRLLGAQVRSLVAGEPLANVVVEGSKTEAKQ